MILRYDKITTALKKVFGKNCLIYLIYILLIALLFCQKTDFEMDELLTYNLANREQWFNPETGIKYSPAEQPFLDAITSNGKINLKNVWVQQENDTHPPFYYVLVHFVCSLFPDSFSVWYAAIINIVFQMLVLWIYRKALMLFVEDKKMINILSLLYVLNSGVLSITLFLRMYIMCMFFAMGLTYLILKHLGKFHFKELLLVGFITVGGTLTHYYFIIYAFFLSVSLIIIMLYKKNYKELIQYSVTMLLAEGISYLIFPAMVRHMFLTGRGAQSMEKLVSSNLWEQIMKYYKMIDNTIFGGTLLILLLTIILLIIVIKKRIMKVGNVSPISLQDSHLYQYFIMIFSMVCYIVIVSKTSPITMERYVSLLYPVILLLIMSLLYRCLKYIFESKSIQIFLCSTIVLIIIVFSFLNCEWNYANFSNRERLENASVYGKGATAVCFYNDYWTLNTAFKEICYCDSVIFYNISTYEEFLEECNISQFGDDIAMFFVGKKADMNVFAKEFIEDNPQYSIVKDNGRFNYVHSIYMKKGTKYK